MKWAGYDTLEVGSHKAMLCQVIVQSIDTQGLRAGNPDVAMEYTVTRTQERLTVR